MSNRPHILVTFGTRPEAIKLAPVVRALQADQTLRVTTCVTAQHRELLDDALSVFDLRPDFDLDLMLPEQELSALTARILGRMREVLSSVGPDMVIVQGDTTTAMATALAAHYARIPIAHVEAGLRTGDVADPWPEEANRRVISRLAELHFAPTELARANLLAEAIDEDAVVMTGNTGIDAARMIEVGADSGLAPGTVLVTTHRRENQRDAFRRVSAVLTALAEAFAERRFLLPLHPNPNVREPLRARLGGVTNFELVEPLEYPAMLAAIRDAAAVVTDSGGVQEEAARFGTGCVVIRETTDRPESVACGLARVAGFDERRAVEALRHFVDSGASAGDAPRGVFGDGRASERIVAHIRRHFCV